MVVDHLNVAVLLTCAGRNTMLAAHLVELMNFSKVSSLVPLYRKYPRTLTFQSFYMACV
jgi:hypothetical protein